jgi:methylisocitrate lyase
MPGEQHPLLSSHSISLSAGVWDALSAKLAERAGFRSVVLSGYAVSGALLGEPDFGYLTQSEVLETARRVCRAVSIPVIVDGDTGYGGVLNVQYLVRELVRIGARGVILEDQVWPKRCGHMRDKSVVPLEEHAAKIAAAREARGDAPFIIVGRTDARAPLGLDEAIRRGNAYKEAGADVIFVEAPETVEELERIVNEVKAPVTLNVIDGGKTPRLSLERVHELGFFSVGYVLTGLFAAAKAMDEAFRHLRAHGTSEGLDQRMMSFEEFTGLLGLEEKYATDERFKRAIQSPK